MTEERMACPTCNPDGDEDPNPQCPTCHGSGGIRAKKCPNCDGEGCTECNQTGWVPDLVNV